MSRDGSIELDWADGRYTFRLRIGELRMLQEACDAGPLVILRRLAGGTWRVDDVTQVVRLGLIGGGQNPEKALALLRDYVESRPLLETVPLASGILNLALAGAADEDPGEAAAAPEAETV